MNDATGVRAEAAQDKMRPHGAGGPSIRPLLQFAAVALPTGWVLLALPLVLDLPEEPFILLALLVGLVLPAVRLTAKETGRAGVRRLLRDTVRLPRPWWWGAFAALALPVLLWGAAAATGGAEPLTGELLTGFLVAVVSSWLIINLWEEMAWTGFAQRRAIARWGVLRGSVATAMLFAGIHLPLAFYDADTTGEVLQGVAVLVGTGIGLRLLIARLDVWSGGSLLTIGLLHATFNGSAELVDPAYDWMRYTVTVLMGVGVVLVAGPPSGPQHPKVHANRG